MCALQTGGTANDVMHRRTSAGVRIGMAVRGSYLSCNATYASTTSSCSAILPTSHSTENLWAMPSPEARQKLTCISKPSPRLHFDFGGAACSIAPSSAARDGKARARWSYLATKKHLGASKSLSNPQTRHRLRRRWHGAGTTRRHYLLEREGYQVHGRTSNV